ncbi:MAG: DUF167 domain-containing protein [Bacillota bacterium]
MYIRITATPGGKREEITKEKDDAWRITVREPAQHNLANERIRVLVARELSISLASVRILSGHHSRSKLLSVDLD